MTASHAPQDPAPLEAQREQCLLYLLGELDSDQTASFERQLQSSAQLGDELVRQSSLITCLAHSVPRTQTPPLTVTRSHWPIAASIAAVAACIALFLFGVRGDKTGHHSFARLADSSATPNEASEDLLIARAWADNQTSDMQEEYGYTESDRDDLPALAADDLSDSDTTLSWMFVAVSANTDSQLPETENDG